MTPVQRGVLKQNHVDVLRYVAEVEDDVAATFERLAARATPQQRARRLELAQAARDGAERARQLVRQAEARIKRP